MDLELNNGCIVYSGIEVFFETLISYQSFIKLIINSVSVCQIVEGIISSVPLATYTDKQYYALKSGKVGFKELRYGTKSRIPPEYVSIREQPEPLLHFPSPTLNVMYSYRVEEITDKYGEQMGIITSGARHPTGSSLYFAWVFRLFMCGVATLYTTNLTSTARLLTTTFQNSQKPAEEHTTLQRIIRPRIVTRSQNPLVKALMSLSVIYKIGIGEDKSTKLAEQYKSLLDIAMAEPDELMVKGVGKKTADKILKAIGREVE